MTSKPHKTTFRMGAIIDGRLIAAVVSFSPAQPRGVLRELAKFEAERLLIEAVRSDLAGRRI